jgi:transposase-like protein
MKKRRENFTRDEGLALARRYRESGRKRSEFAGSAGVTIATLQYWVCKLNREVRGSAVIQKAVPFVEVVRASAQREYGGCAAVLEMPGARLRFDGLPPARYVAQIAASMAELSK